MTYLNRADRLRRLRRLQHNKFRLRKKRGSVTRKRIEMFAKLLQEAIPAAFRRKSNLKALARNAMHAQKPVGFPSLVPAKRAHRPSPINAPIRRTILILTACRTLSLAWPAPCPRPRRPSCRPLGPPSRRRWASCSPAARCVAVPASRDCQWRAPRQ